MKLTSRTAEIDSQIALYEKQQAALSERCNALVLQYPITRESDEEHRKTIEMIKANEGAIERLKDRRAVAVQLDQADQFKRQKGTTKAAAKALQTKFSEMLKLAAELDVMYTRMRQINIEWSEIGSDAWDLLLTVSQATHAGPGNRHIDAASACRDEVLTGSAGNALLNHLLAAGVGKTGIKADVLLGNMTHTVSAASIASEVEKARVRVAERVDGWIYSASVGPSEPVIQPTPEVGIIDSAIRLREMAILH